MNGGEMETKNYKVRCYTRRGDFDHEEFTDTLEKAKQIRTEWGLSIGLRPEPSYDFAYYPTVWEFCGDVYKRVRGL